MNKIVPKKKAKQLMDHVYRLKCFERVANLRQI